MKTLLALAALALATACAVDTTGDETDTTAAPSVGAKATTAHHGGVSSHAKHAEMLQSKLDLTDEQAAQVGTAMQTSGTHEERHAAIKKVLTDEQLERFETMMANHKKGGHGGACEGECPHAKGGAECPHSKAGECKHGEDGAACPHAVDGAGCPHAKGGECKHGGKKLHKDPAAHAAHLQDKLGLTDEQRTAAKTVFDSFKLDPSGHEKLAEGLREILSADQMTELERMMKEHHGGKHHSGKHHGAKQHGGKHHGAK